MSVLTTDAPRAQEAGPVPLLPRGTSLLAALVLMAGNAMVLAGLLAAWFLLKGSTSPWPPEGAAIDTYIPTVVGITAAMVAFSVQWAVWSIRRNDQRSALVALVTTLVLGVAMFNVEWYQLAQSEVGVADSAYGTIYHLILGYHLLNTGIGILALVVVVARTLVGHFGHREYDSMRAVAATWQYVNASWLFIALALFVFSPHG